MDLIIVFGNSLLLAFRAHHGFGWVGEWANTG